jgi:hypothetical protein
VECALQDGLSIVSPSLRVRWLKNPRPMLPKPGAPAASPMARPCLKDSGAGPGKDLPFLPARR